MTTKDTSGPAFPIHDPQWLHRIGSAAVAGITDPAERDRIYIEATARAAQGMTLRDHFAGLAVQGMLAHNEADYSPMTAAAQTQMAKDAYAMADAMLKARNA